MEKVLNNFVARGHAAQIAADQAIKQTTTQRKDPAPRNISPIPYSEDVKAGAARGSASVHKIAAPASGRDDFHVVPKKRKS